MRENDASSPTESTESSGPSGPSGSSASSGLAFRSLLREQRVWDTGDAGLPPFDPAQAPGDPLTLFHLWFAGAVAAGQPEPHTMTLATAGADGLPDARTVMLHDADGRGWHFATHTTSRKGRQLAARPYAALTFYWHAQARAVRVRGPVHPVPSAETSADLHARSTGALAAALAGRQSEVLGSREELRSTYESAWRRAERDPAAEAPTWTGHVVVPDEVEFFQGDAHRQHVRLRYVRDVRNAADAAGPGAAWRRELLWP